VLPLAIVCQSTTYVRSRQSNRHDDPSNSERIDHLLPEVRSAVTRMGNTAQAAHYFGTYFDNSRLIRLHFEHLHCVDQAHFCRDSSCLRQDYISSGGHYRS
jgi:hypothetical protein